ncbi:MAG TPA: PAS domain-containing protein [Steroidobacteraceae bacterium]
MNLAQLVDHLPGLVLATSSAAHATYVSEPWVALTGASRAAAEGVGWLEYVHPSDAGALLEGWARMEAGAGGVARTVRLRAGDGSWQHFRVSATPIVEADGSVAACVGLFVRDSAPLLQRWLNDDAAVRPILDSIPGSVTIMCADGSVEFVNRAGLEYRGATIDELRPWKTSGSIHPDDVAGAIALWDQCLRTGAPFDREHRIRRHDGIYRWFHVRGAAALEPDGSVSRWCFLDEDIDDIRSSEARLRTLINAGPGVVWIADYSGSVEFLNDRWYAYTGMSAPDSLGNGWASAVHPDDFIDLLQYWASLLASSEAGQYEARLRAADGSYRWFLIRTVPHLNESGQLVKWFGANTDIDDRKRAEEMTAALVRTRSELAHVARVITLGALTASIAHEVNQPLAGIIANASTCLRLLNADDPDIEAALATARRTIRDAYRASDVITRLRALFAKRETVRQPLDMDGVVADVASLVSGEVIRHGVKLQFKSDGQAKRTLADPVQLQQVILNLLLNAIEAVVENVDSSKVVSLDTWQDDAYVYVAVRDSGHGIDPETSAQMFSAFFTTKEGGMGIGLSISQSIIQSLGGDISAKSNPWGGATFLFHLPRFLERTD